MLLLMGIYIFAHDDGIIYDDAEDHDEGEQADEADGNIH